MSIESYILLSMAFYFALTWEMVMQDKENELASEEWLTLKHKERLRHLQGRARTFRRLRYFVAILFMAQAAVDITRVILAVIRS